MGYVYIALTVLLTVAGQLLIKKGMLELGEAPSDGTLIRFIISAFLNFKVIGGLTAAVGAAVTWMLALSKVDISFAYPFMGSAIVFVLALSPMMFGETVPWNRWLGVALVCMGLIVAAQGG